MSAPSQDHFVTCPLCEATCGLKVTVSDGVVTRIRGDRDDVFSKGFICPKGSTLRHFQDDPDRLRQPVARRGQEFVSISWDEAFETIAAGLDPILAEGPRDALALYHGNPTVHGAGTFLYRQVLAGAAGTRNVFSSATLDQMPKQVSSGLMFGDENRFTVPDIDRTDFLLLLGANPFVSNGSLCTAPDWPGRLASLQERGGRYVVVDPRRTATADHADVHLSIKPGTDIHLLLGMLHHLFERELVDLGSVADHISGLAAVEAAVAPFSPAAVSARCGIDASDIAWLAEQVAGADTAAVYGRMGSHAAPFGTVTAWAIDVLNTVTGNLDSPGGVMFASPPWERIATEAQPGPGFSTGAYASRVDGYPEVMGQFPSSTMADEILTPGDGRIRALILIGGNPVRSVPNSRNVDAALKSLDFMVAIDPYINESTRHADVILPPRTPLERSQFDLVFYSIAVRMVANWSDPVLDTAAPDDLDVVARLSLILAGVGPTADPALIHHQFRQAVIDADLADPDSPLHGVDLDRFAETLAQLPPEEALANVFLRMGRYDVDVDTFRDQPHGIDWGPLVPRIPGIVRTPDGMVQLAPSSIMADLDRVAGGQPETEGSFQLIGRRDVRSNNSWMHNMQVLMRGRDRCTLMMHPDDAATVGLGPGDAARISTPQGSVIAPVELTDAIRPGVVSLPHGYGHDGPDIKLRVAAERPGVNYNDLGDHRRLDPLSGNAALNGYPVVVAPCD